ncbi:MAG: ribosomal protection-like ABC-F family protein [Anaerolineae bacterium]
MSIVTGNGLGMYFGAQDVFSGIEFSIARGDKIGLVGPNGAGKTTLLRILMGREEPTAGTVVRAHGLRIGYLPQKPEFSSDQTLYAEMLTVFEGLQRQQADLLQLAEELASADSHDEIMQRYAEAEQRFDLAGGYEYENRIRRVLSGLGFGPETNDWPITTLSGGQVTRALLAKLLLQEPELLVLDEPTNYLDLAALEWLEGYLQSWQQSVLVVSHDRYFLDHVTNRIWELNHGTLETYRGNYSAFLVQREDRRALQQRLYEEQRETIAETEAFIRRYKAGQRSKQARGREERLNRLERVEAPRDNRHMHLRLSTSLRAGDNVLTSEGAVIGYPSRPDASADDGEDTAAHPLFNTDKFLMLRGQRVALLGPNGSGKTTFLRTLLGQLPPLAGRIRLGASVRLGYLPQNQNWLDPDKTVLEQVYAESSLHMEEARSLLGRFLFSADDVYKRVGTLSGGERSRLALAILTIRGANLLLLDEPTTHLDLDSQEILQQVLVGFGGTILMVSHDRYLVDAVATHVWAIQDGRMRVIEGNYTAYLQQLEQERLGARGPERETRADERNTEAIRRERKVQREARRRAERTESLEEEITRLEQQLAALTEQIDQASTAQDPDRVHVLSRDYQQVETALAELLTEWEEAVGAHENEG